MGPCMSLLGVSVPTIEFPAEEVANQTAEIIKGIPDKIKEAQSTLESEYGVSKSKDEDLTVSGGKDGKAVLMVISKSAEEEALKKDIRKAAHLMVAKGEFAAQAAAQVWGAVEPKIDETKPEIPDTPIMTGAQIWAKAKEKVQEKVEAEVAAKIEAACDEALKKEEAA